MEKSKKIRRSGIDRLSRRGCSQSRCVYVRPLPPRATRFNYILTPYEAHALFASPAQAMRATEKLHAHTFKGSVLSAILKKRHDNLVKPNKQTTVSGKAPSRNSRLIIRNLPWNVSVFILEFEFKFAFSKPEIDIVSS